MLVNENNASDGASERAQTDAMILTSKWLHDHPEECRVDLLIQPESAKRGRGRLKGEQHKHGSQRCVVAFLGEANWSQPTVSRLLSWPT
jgi:hypothetical protein